MKTQLTNIFKQQGSISRQEMQDYLSGKLQGEDRLRVERILAENNLEAEAMEGLENDPKSLSALPLMPSFLTEGTIPVKNTYKNLFWGASAFAIVATVIAVYSVMNSGETNAPKPESTLIAQENTNEEEQNLKDEQELIEIENAVPISNQEQITYKKTVENQAQTIIEIKPEEIILPVNDPEVIEPKKAEPIPENELENKVARSNVKFSFLHDLKVIDYSGLYTSDIKKTQLTVPTGTPANLANENSKNELEPEIRIVYVPYEAYLKETMYEFSQNDFKTSLKNFKLIHQHYPEDLNAFFYGGLCYYNLGKWDKAISYFDKCINNSFSTFEEEAQWYKALCLIKNKQNEAAKLLLQDIVKSDGFYGAKAAVKLKEVK